MRLVFDKIKSWQIWLGLLVVVLIVYGRTLLVGFLSDDWHWLWLSGERPWSLDIFLTNYEGGIVGGAYNPLTFVLFKISYSLFGLQAWPYHLVSLLVFTANGYLVYLLSRKIFILAQINYSKLWALFSAILFLLWPVQVEVVNWLAAWPHLWGTGFYLLTFLFYFKWRQEKNNNFFWWSLLSFVLALLTKELAISLPFLIVLWESLFYSLDKKNKFNGRIIFYFPLLFIFLMLRYSATQTLFGYYGRTEFNWPLWEWMGNLGAFLNDLFTFGFFRELYYKIWYHELSSLVIIILVSLAAYFWFTFWYRKWLQFILSSSIILCLLPLSPLGMQRLSFADERYLYLASSFFVIWLVLVLNNLFKQIKISQFILLALLVISIPILLYKNNNWQLAGKISRETIASFAELTIDENKPLVSVGLPDNLSGAQVWRNNLQQALALTYSDYDLEIIPLPIYTMIDKDNYQQSLLKWRTDSLGWFAESVNGSFVVTGQTSLTRNNIYWELWNYNYQNFTANIIRLMPQDNSGRQWLTFDRGKLKLIH